jgi:hypothetical protein
MPLGMKRPCLPTAFPRLLLCRVDAAYSGLVAGHVSVPFACAIA